MKYRLKKELPFAEAGAEILLKDAELVIPFNDICLVSARNHFAYMPVAHIHDLPTLIQDEWIEEIKPREYYIGLTPQGNLPAFECVADNIEFFDTLKYTPAKIIKVREVIE